jgi:hypothetical protein
MILDKDVEEMAEELADMARIDGTENGEWWAALVAMREVIHYGASDRFIKAWIAEIKSEHKRLKRDFKLTEEVVEQKRTVRRLDFIG